MSRWKKVDEQEDAVDRWLDSIRRSERTARIVLIALAAALLTWIILWLT